MGLNHTLERNFGSHVLAFNGKKLSEFGVHVSGEDTFAAPERDVEYVTIPGRNGDLLVDNGRFLNVTVSYACGITENFDENFSKLKSWLQHEAGYHRLEDSYHPDEYRMAAFVGAIKPDMGAYNESGKFSLEFVCKPQRFLLSGDQAVRYYPVACGSINATTGENTTDTSMCRLGYVEVTPGAEVTIEVGYAKDAGQKGIAAFYTQAKKLLTVTTATASAGRISYSGTAPTTAAYIQFAWPVGTASVTVVNGGVVTCYGDYGPVIDNPTLFTAMPMITVGNGEAAKVSINDMIMAISAYRNATKQNSITVDCEAQDCYSGSVNMNSYVSFTTSEGDIAYEYPTFTPGENTIHTSSYPVGTAAASPIEYMEIKARWWRT